MRADPTGKPADFVAPSAWTHASLTHPSSGSGTAVSIGTRPVRVLAPTFGERLGGDAGGTSYRDPEPVPVTGDRATRSSPPALTVTSVDVPRSATSRTVALTAPPGPRVMSSGATLHRIGTPIGAMLGSTASTTRRRPGVPGHQPACGDVADPEQPGHLHRIRPVEDRPPGAVLEHSAVVDDHHLVGQERGLLRVVGDEHRGDPGGGQQPAQVVAQVVALGGVERGEGLVEEQEVGCAGQRPGQGHPLGLAARQLVGIAVAQPGQPDPLRPEGGGPGSARGLIMSCSQTVRCGSRPDCWGT